MHSDNMRTVILCCICTLAGGVLTPADLLPWCCVDHIHVGKSGGTAVEAILDVPGVALEKETFHATFAHFKNKAAEETRNRTCLNGIVLREPVSLFVSQVRWCAQRRCKHSHHMGCGFLKCKKGSILERTYLTSSPHESLPLFLERPDEWRLGQNPTTHLLGTNELHIDRLAIITDSDSATAIERLRNSLHYVAFADTFDDDMISLFGITKRANVNTRHPETAGNDTSSGSQGNSSFLLSSSAIETINWLNRQDVKVYTAALSLRANNKGPLSVPWRAITQDDGRRCREPFKPAAPSYRQKHQNQYRQHR